MIVGFFIHFSVEKHQIYTLKVFFTCCNYGKPSATKNRKTKPVVEDIKQMENMHWAFMEDKYLGLRKKERCMCWNYTEICKRKRNQCLKER